MTRREAAGAALAILGMTLFVTWPQALHMGSKVAAHHDPEFSIWRLAWIAHALATDPRHLLSANIFYPSPDTLTYSDATLLEGVVAAPLFWAGVAPIWIYNLLLLGGFVASGAAAFLLARRLTGTFLPALIAAAVFTMAPYRIEHFMHVELQWAMWVPAALWAAHRAFDERSRRFGLLTGVFVWLQLLSCVYYGVFLAIALAVFATVMAALDWKQRSPGLLNIGMGGAAAGVLSAPYLWFYYRTAQTVGVRHPEEVARYSARLSSYFSSPGQNWLWGWTESTPELGLFIGLVALVLVVFAVGFRPRSVTAAYIGVAVVSVSLSLGMNSALYRALLDILPVLQGLRSPSRFAVIASCAIAILAALGARTIQVRLARRSSAWATGALLSFLVLLFVEYGNTGMILMNLPTDFGTVYQTVRSTGPGVVIELPLPTAEALPGHEPDYQYWSIDHWHPLVNGYSGYYPPRYLQMLDRMRRFPDDDSIEALRSLEVRYILVHAAFFDRDAYGALLARAGARADLMPYGRYKDPFGDVELFVLKP